MTIRTAFTAALSVEHPIALAPMGDVAGGKLAAAVSNGGGLGLVGGGRGDPYWLERELAIVAASTARPWGVGLLTWSISEKVIDQALRQGPRAMMLSFGDPEPFARMVKEAGVKLIIQVTDLDEARRALDVGVDVIVAQGSEAGGHGGRRATLPLVPAVVDLAAPIPVLAAGGIADGRGLAAALALGAAGVLVGTRFEATTEALLSASEVTAILAASGDQTERGRTVDIARESPWPARYPGRTLRNTFIEQWRDRDAELLADGQARRDFQLAVREGDMSALPIWAGEDVDLVNEVVPAADLVGVIVTQAEEALSGAVGLIK